MSAARPDVRTLEIGDEVVLYDPAGRRAHLLNHSARAVWETLATTTDPAGVAKAVAARFATDPATVADDVAATVKAFADAGLLGAPVPVPPPRTPGLPTDRTALADPEQSPETHRTTPLPHQLGPHLLLHHRFTVATDDDALVDRLRPVVADLLDDPAVESGQPMRYEVTATDDGQLLITVDGQVARTARDADDALGFLYWHLHRRAIDSTDDLVRLHASAIRVGESVVAFPAPPESGKSTLVAGLVRAGFAYVTDEAVAVDPTDLHVVRVPLPITLDPGSWPLFADALGPDPTAGRSGSAHLPAETLNPVAHLGDPAPTLAACVMHRYQAGASPALERSTPTEALLGLLENAFGLETANDAVFDALRRMALEIPCYRLVHGGLDQAEAAVRRVLEELGID